MSRHDLDLWIDIYAAMGLCCTIAALLSALRVVWLYRNDDRLRPVGMKGWVLAAPLLWWRWQKIYLTTAPVTLGIIVLFGWTLQWSQSPAAVRSPAANAADRLTVPTRN